jgi:hypothetical protein
MKLRLSGISEFRHLNDLGKKYGVVYTLQSDKQGYLIDTEARPAMQKRSLRTRIDETLGKQRKRKIEDAREFIRNL